MNIEIIVDKIKTIFDGDYSGHDYWHSLRVYKNAIKIAESECCNKSLVEIAALLHDVDDRKLFDTNDHDNARKIMNEAGINVEIQKKVIAIIEDVSFKGKDSVVPETIEGKIVQDADRLDAMGAIGIARTFAFGGNNNRCIYDPETNPELDMNGEKYYSNEGTSVNHFFEKLFLLKDMMNTKLAKEIAISRDQFMHDFLEEFMMEWKDI